MNTIFFNKRYELKPNYYVIPFSCSDMNDIDTEVSFRDRTVVQQKALDSIHDRIASVLLQRGFILQNVNFRNMAISCIKVDQ